MTTFYIITETSDEAYDLMPSFESAQIKTLREKAEEHRRRERESFERCDTDGFVSQWCSSISAADDDEAAALADRGNLSVFPVLVDAVTGELVATTIHIFQNRYSYGNEYKWAVRRQNAQKAEWVTDFKRESNFGKKGLRKAWMIAPAKLYSRHPANHLPEARGMAGLASYCGKSIGIDYDAIGMRP